MADARLINFSEKLLTGSIGSASAKILISSVVKEEEVSLVEVLKILEESKETIANNKLLKDKSNELMQLSNQLKLANAELLQKDKQKDEFLDTVAHELKTPITGIRAATEVLLEDDDEMPKDLRQRFLENMLNDSDRLSRLIHSILDFEKLSTGRAHLNIAKHNIRETIKKSLDSLSQLAAKKNVQLWCTNKSDYYLKYDEDRILQVFTNLISNALKFTEPAKGNIYIQYKYDNGYLEIQVSDNGKGIPDEDLPYVFDKFYQSKDQNTKKPHGSGLGLAISKQIIDNHGGKIWVENNAKTGATFSFTLPFVK
jgi:signal transduction histidine kinase